MGIFRDLASLEPDKNQSQAAANKKTLMFLSAARPITLWATSFGEKRAGHSRRSL
jgi:hypothetical protein